ncbi:Copper transport protein CTR2 [Choanephora cucurbitarum]|uniref:Copper transport protein n=1 Tax=Choanephora cucurbitarum TaxID=101091 RepID=A0A1C7NIW9_9FUNG|nr:Copper transport protein CTR2 [Choanephora cucurbitarum]
MDHTNGHNMEEHSMPASCDMNMLFNWQTQNVCIVFEWWHVHNAAELFLSCIAVFCIATAYEYLRVWTAQWDEQWSQAEKKRLSEQNVLVNDLEEEAATHPTDNTSFLIKDLQKKPYSNRQARHQHILRSVLYAVLVAISFWLMLVFMTYNGYLMIATILGAGFGHLVFGKRSTVSRGIQCH